MDTTWISVPATDDPAPYRHATKSSFLRVMLDFRDFYRTQGNPDAITAVVNNRIGDRLRLGIPHNWYVELLPQDKYEQLRDVSLSDLVCCEERITVLGKVVMQEGDIYKDVGAALCLGQWGRVYIYEISEDALILVSYDIDKLARFGLIHCETLYRKSYLPQVTLLPHHLVSGMIMAQESMTKLAEFCRLHTGHDIALYTPGYRYRPFKIMCDLSYVSMYWPFDNMPRTHMDFYIEEITARLSCKWQVIGAIGLYSPPSAFTIEHVLLIDYFCVVYTIDVSREKFYRVADNVSMLFRGGICKAIAFGSRFDRNKGGIERVESRTICPHAKDFKKLNKNEDEYDVQHRWLCRADRFRPDMRTWDAADKQAIEHVVKNRRIEQSLNHHETRFNTEEKRENIEAAVDDECAEAADECTEAADECSEGADNIQEDEDSECDSSGSENDGEYSDSSLGFDGYKRHSPGTDDGRRKFVYWPENLLCCHWTKRTDQDTLIGYMMESTVSIEEVKKRRVLEKETYNHAGLPVSLPRV
nr:protein m140 [Mastomys natalensis cytomegalovirus 3]WEG69956.1 protein m140 [Mastomys natalensis cytomegalovirus 3]WEG70096.1 protein m140 [Mastomys natalensis cytomegalovirus 3]WEG70236.1 protein m140 [Mastomys natalensis cytomegalovirus 3]WEG70376.1 protein m140 [Mastomys natalensis cytomegalovirus 3]